MPGTVIRTTIAWGDAGAHQTLTTMDDIVHQSLDMPLVKEFAEQLTVNMAPRDYERAALMIQAWLATYFRFVPDALGHEQLKTPEYQLRYYRQYGQAVGDCDDAAILGAALGMAVGIPATFVVLGFDTPDSRGRMAHVYTVLLPPDGIPVSLDVTKPAAPAPPVLRSWEMDV